MFSFYQITIIGSLTKYVRKTFDFIFFKFFFFFYLASYFFHYFILHSQSFIQNALQLSIQHNVLMLIMRIHERSI